MGRIEKTVFISYRRTNFWIALAIFQNLHANGYDVFFDYKSIPSGDFEQVIVENVKSRAHFIIVLTPSALERCNEPEDWLRREIEIAIDNQRNIIPLMVESFDFDSPATLKALTGKLGNLKKYNALGIPAEYFDEAMIKLRSERYLNRPLESVSHPVSDITRLITEKQKNTASEAAQIEKEQLTAQEWFERGYLFHRNGDLDDAIRCYTKAIVLRPEFHEAYSFRAQMYGEKGDFDKAIADHNQAINLMSDVAEAYVLRASALTKIGELDKAIKDYDEAIRLKTNIDGIYSIRGFLQYKQGNFTKAIHDFDEAIRLKPDSFDYYNRGRALKDKGELEAAIRDFTEAINIKPDYVLAYQGRMVARFRKGDLIGALSDFFVTARF